MAEAGYKTLRVRVKDKHAAKLRAMSVSVNFVWNYLNDISYRSIRERGRFMTAFDMWPYLAGASKDLGILSGTLTSVAAMYAQNRNRDRKARLAWRKSFGSRRSLGWIPIRKSESSWRNGAIYHNGHLFDVWDSFGLGQYEFRNATFCEDARGRWYFNVTVEVSKSQRRAKKSVGVDLGCKEAATCSDGTKLTGRRYRELESSLGLAQRANKRSRARAIHAQIANRRKDDLHKFTTKIAKENAAVFVGNVSSNKLTKTKMAKSVLDAGWGMMKTMLEYKCDYAGVIFEVVDEAHTTQACSCCGLISDSSPKGRAGLGIREWTCECGVTHDRDVNAAKNILALGHERLAEGSLQ